MARASWSAQWLLVFGGFWTWTPRTYPQNRTGWRRRYHSTWAKCNEQMGAAMLATLSRLSSFTEATLLTTGDCFAHPSSETALEQRLSGALSVRAACLPPGQLRRDVTAARRDGFPRVLAWFQEHRQSPCGQENR